MSTALQSPWVLAVETSGRTGGVALLRGTELVAERVLEEKQRRHAQGLVAEVAAVLKGAGVSPDGVGAVGVSVGPGSFTGLRVGVVFAKTFAWATGARLVAVDTLLAIAENSPAEVQDLWVLSDAQRDDVYAGRYVRATTGAFESADPVAVLSLRDWLSVRTPGEIVSGPGVDKLTEEAARSLTALEPSMRLPRAAVVGRLTSQGLARGAFADAATLEPFYLRKAAAEELRDGP